MKIEYNSMVSVVFLLDCPVYESYPNCLKYPKILIQFLPYLTVFPKIKK